MPPSPRLLVLTAHPDDPEVYAGGLICGYRSLGREVKLVSVTDGGAGHQEKTAAELAPLRRAEAAAAGAVVGASYEVWEFPDGRLLPTLEVRERIIREIRAFRADLVLTHRTCDYHPDHRAVAQAVQDASYLVTVPAVVTETPALRRGPVVAYLPDLFERPAPLRADRVIDVTPHLDTIVRMLTCHASQVFEWLPYQADTLDTVPTVPEERLAWVKEWFVEQIRPWANRYRDAMVAAFGESDGQATDLVEIFEISEYGRQPNAALLDELFPLSIDPMTR
ncbi:MAG TPA: PIG-L family deacetylase [Vicinamibacterales bacterium]|nr:GlcNAc-PI de-N-acetylase [Acidobacteriota bacterium]MDP7339075.1 PIG-L family deacetylase [Vicinamibacterales bacterium]MDP7480079.1 PIG-L family deacetylase [Vicinamibacterales bacterium]HJO37554.1 PIG-L family deacetylase [Vicinamibacterales bacterium]